MSKVLLVDATLEEALAYCAGGRKPAQDGGPVSIAALWDSIAVARRARGDRAGAARAKVNAGVKRDARRSQQGSSWQGACWT